MANLSKTTEQSLVKGWGNVSFNAPFLVVRFCFNHVLVEAFDCPIDLALHHPFGLRGWENECRRIRFHRSFERSFSRSATRRSALTISIFRPIKSFWMQGYISDASLATDLVNYVHGFSHLHTWFSRNNKNNLNNKIWTKRFPTYKTIQDYDYLGWYYLADIFQ